MSELLAVMAWASDALLRELLEQEGWTVRIVATRGDRVEAETMRGLFLAALPEDE